MSRLEWTLVLVLAAVIVIAAIGLVEAIPSDDVLRHLADATRRAAGR